MILYFTGVTNFRILRDRRVALPTFKKREGAAMKKALHLLSPLNDVP